MIKFRRDEHNTLSKAVKDIIRLNQEFELLKHLRFRYFYYMDELQYDEFGFPREGGVKKCTTTFRDKYNTDVEFWVHADTWELKPERLKQRLIYSLLLRIHVETNEHLEVARDEDERVRFTFVKPDLIIAAFSKELERYGLHPEHRAVLHQLEAKRMRERNGEENA